MNASTMEPPVIVRGNVEKILDSNFDVIYNAGNNIIAYVEDMLTDDISIFQKQQLLFVKGEVHKILHSIFTEMEVEISAPVSKIIANDSTVIDDVITHIHSLYETQFNQNEINLNIYKSLESSFSYELDPVLVKRIFISIIEQSLKILETGDIDLFIKVTTTNDSINCLEFNTVVTGRISKNYLQEISNTENYSFLCSLNEACNSEFEITKPSENLVACKVLMNVGKVNTEEDALEISIKEDISDKKCLVVDDSKQFAKLFYELLTRAGVKCEVARNGFEATELVDSNSYDFIVMDIQMPVMGGIEAAKEIRNRADDKKDIKILAVTANLEDDIETQCMEAGFTDFLQKPFHPDLLLKKLNSFFTMSSPTMLLEPELVISEPLQVETKLPGYEIDLSYLKSISKNDLEFEKDMIESSIVEIEEDLIEFELGVSTNSKVLISNCAHSIKSLCAIIGLTELFQTFAVIEKQFLDVNPQPLSTIVLEELRGNWLYGKNRLLEIVKQGY